MDFELSEEQRLLKDSVERLTAQRYDFEARKKYMKEADGWSRALWQQYAELGLTALPFGEEHGGVGGGAVETMIVMEAFGRALALEPYFASVVLGGSFVKLGASDKTKAAVLPKVATGEMLLALAHVERQARYDLADVATTAKKDGADFVLNGEKSLAVHGDCADKIIVSARVSGAQRDRSGIGLFLVDATAGGVSRRGYPTMDGQRAAEVSLAGVKVGADDVIGEAGNAFPLLEQVSHIAIAALAAEAVGAMGAMHELTVDYLKQRKQFGVPIGNFQVLQHRAGEMLIALEQARSMAMLATMMAEEQNAEERRKAISAAKVQIGRSAKFVGQQAIQLHGGIGMTMEYKVGHYFKRITMIDTMFGDADYHLAALARQGGIIGAR
ncbi:MAG TPA: acyl-CoA dehydrogenase family protein [Xanthobacteraceae bacterium]|nr:acyl-CoA dehydrogenase family protein [Xanthobacteraceae bacterium]